VSYRSIAAIAAAAEEDASVLRAAGLLAARFGAHVRVIPAFRDPTADYYGTVLNRVLPSVAAERIEAAKRENCEAIELAARGAAQEFGLAVSEDLIGGLSIHVEKLSFNLATVISNVSALCDLIVFGAQAVRDRSPLRDVFGVALVFDRAPTLLVRGDHAALGAPVAIAWDASAQAGRAVRAALPILAQAPAVAILQCPQGLTGMQREAADPARLRLYLMQHGVIEPKVVLTEGRPEGNALLAAARAGACGVLVAGGYGRSRLREWALGGATRTFVEADEGPHLFLHH
jgi:nucleotide-binding universal stress UspA family protein